ncbi:hypothetical protein [Corynebacterium sp. 335C]
MSKDRKDVDRSVTLDDGTVVTWESWELGKPSHDGSRHVAPVLRDGEQVSEYVIVDDDEAIAAPGGVWRLDVEPGRLTAALPDGRTFATVAEDKPKFSRAKRISVDFAAAATEAPADDAAAAARDAEAARAAGAEGADAEASATAGPTAGAVTPDEVRILCETSQHYVIEDVKGAKLGQFTGASHGVRAAEIQFDTPEGRALSDDQKMYLTWSARHILEARMVSSTWILTVCLLLLIAYLAYIWVL